MSKFKVVSFTTDFGVQTQGIGLMEGVVLSIAPAARVIHLMHGLPAFDITAAARTLEAIRYMPLGAHVCVCDPGVGTARKAIACQVGRGDYFVGPDNGVLVPAARILGGIESAHEITNPAFMRRPVSPIFHGRDIFAPAAAHLFNGLSIDELGPKLQTESLVEAPYNESLFTGDGIDAMVIQINHFGSLHLNVLHEDWDKLGLSIRDIVILNLSDRRELELPVCETFGNVNEGEPLILKDDYGRVEVAINRGAFAPTYKVKIGDPIRLRPKRAFKRPSDQP